MAHQHRHTEKPADGEAVSPEAVPGPEALGGSEEILEAQPAGENGGNCGCGRCEEDALPAAEEVLKQELAKVNDRYLRLAADFDNFRKRQVKERADLIAYANETMVLDILPVLDNLERAMSASGTAKDLADGHAGVIKGVELTMRMFQQILGRNGVERLKTVGLKFNPHHHEAIAKVHTGDAEPETVIEEAEAGYSLNGRVIRPAKVKVAKPPAPAPQEEQAEEEELKAKEDTNA